MQRLRTEARKATGISHKIVKMATNRVIDHFFTRRLKGEVHVVVQTMSDGAGAALVVSRPGRGSIRCLDRHLAGRDGVQW